MLNSLNKPNATIENDILRVYNVVGATGYVIKRNGKIIKRLNLTEYEKDLSFDFNKYGYYSRMWNDGVFGVYNRMVISTYGVYKYLGNVVYYNEDDSNWGYQIWTYNEFGVATITKTVQPTLFGINEISINEPGFSFAIYHSYKKHSNENYSAYSFLYDKEYFEEDLSEYGQGVYEIYAVANIYDSRNPIIKKNIIGSSVIINNFKENKCVLYNNSSEEIRLDKFDFLSNELIMNITFRDSVSIINPTLLIEYDKDIFKFNYCYLSAFNRYYYIDDIVSVRTNMWELSLRVDPLMSFKDKILELDCKINRQEFNYNPDLVDHEQLVEVEPIIEEVVGTVNGSGFEINSLIDINKPAIENYNIVVSTSSYRLNDIFKEIPHIYSEATAPTSNYFILTPLLLNSFAYSLYNTSPSEDKAYVEPSECLRSVRIYPFNVIDYEGKLLFGTQKHINVGVNALPLFVNIPPSATELNNFYSTIVVNSVTSVVIRGGSITIPKMYNNFLDYEPYTIIELYIPFIGWVKLPTNLVNGKKLYSKYIVDLETGTAINEIRIDEGKYTQTQGSGSNLIPAKDENFLIMTTECDIGYDIPIVRMNTTDQMKRERIANIKSALRWVKTATDIASTVANVASGGITGKLQMAKGLTAGNVGNRLKGYRAEQTVSGVSGAGGIISSIANTIGENKIDKINAMQYNATSGQAGDSVLANCTVGLKLIARIYHPNPIDVPNYNHLVGRPSDYSGQLKNLQGYTEVGACHMEGFDTATPSEVAEIENEIKTGVIL